MRASISADLSVRKRSSPNASQQKLAITEPPILFEIEETGVLIDRKMLKTQSGELAVTMLELQEKAHELAGGPFNLGSPKQLQQIHAGTSGLRGDGP